MKSFLTLIETDASMSIKMTKWLMVTVCIKFLFNILFVHQNSSKIRKKHFYIPNIQIILIELYKYNPKAIFLSIFYLKIYIFKKIIFRAHCESGILNFQYKLLSIKSRLF